MAYTKTLTFRSNDLRVNTTLMLIFDKASDGLYKDKFPVVWKAFKFKSAGPQLFTATFSSQLAWLKPAKDMGFIVGASAYTPINYNQKTTLKQDGSGVLSFTTPETGTPDSVTVVNGTQLRQDVAFGFLPQGACTPVPVYYWNGLGAGQNIQTNFQPVVRVYMATGDKEGEIVRGELIFPPDVEQDLSALGDNTTWDIRFDYFTGRFSFTRV